MCSKTFVAVLLVLCMTPVALAAAPSEAPGAQVAGVSSATGGCGQAVPAGLVGVLPLAQAIGDIGAAGCCYSDPCPGWGTFKVSCCENGCSAYSDHVWCPSSGDIYCPDPCAFNMICNPSCQYDPDCECHPGLLCFKDSDCRGGYCDIDWELGPPGQCVCD